MGRLFTAVILIGLMLITFCGCSLSNYGQLKSNPEVTQTFKNYKILPDTKYYYWGTFGQPVAIVGINSNYTLNSKVWVPIDPESKDFRTLINKVSLQGTGNIAHPWGFTILDNAGNDVGVWYSAIRAAAVKIDANGQIVNLSPIRTATIGDQAP